jgi:hypothetical protein
VEKGGRGVQEEKREKNGERGNVGVETISLPSFQNLELQHLWNGQFKTFEVNSKQKRPENLRILKSRIGKECRNPS